MSAAATARAQERYAPLLDCFRSKVQWTVVPTRWLGEIAPVLPTVPQRIWTFLHNQTGGNPSPGQKSRPRHWEGTQRQLFAAAGVSETAGGPALQMFLDLLIVKCESTGRRYVGRYSIDYELSEDIPIAEVEREARRYSARVKKQARSSVEQPQPQEPEVEPVAEVVPIDRLRPTVRVGTISVIEDHEEEEDESSSCPLAGQCPLAAGRTNEEIKANKKRVDGNCDADLPRNAGIQDHQDWRWNRIRAELQAQLSPEAFANWVSGARPLGLDAEGVLHVEAPNEFSKEWLESEYAPLITPLLPGLGIERVEYRVASSCSATVRPAASTSTLPPPIDEEHLVKACPNIVGSPNESRIESIRRKLQLPIKSPLERFWELLFTKKNRDRFANPHHHGQHEWGLVDRLAADARDDYRRELIRITGAEVPVKGVVS